MNHGLSLRENYLELFSHSEGDFLHILYVIDRKERTDMLLSQQRY
jgi:hypothetical protein